MPDFKPVPCLFPTRILQKQKRGMSIPSRSTRPGVPEAVKTEVTTKANELIESVLKPLHIKPPPENPQFNDAIPIVVVRRFGAREIAPQGQEVESASAS
jgi:hypothetical protein